MEMDISTVELVIDGEYTIKPLMTIEEIKESNLKDIMIGESQIKLEENIDSSLIIRRNINGEVIFIQLNITEGNLTGIYITTEEEFYENEHKRIENEKSLEENNHNIQIQPIEGINEDEQKKVQDLCDLYGEFPSEEALVQRISELQNEINSIVEQMDNISQEKSKLELVEEAFRTIEENANTYDIYEASGFNNDILKNNESSIEKYEKAKELLKRTDNKDKMHLDKRINQYKQNLEKLQQTKNSLTMELNQISDSYSAHQKYKDIGTNNLDELKIELLCNLKAQDELNIVFLNNNNDKRAKNFWEVNKQEIEMNIENLENQINAIGITNKSEIDYNIDYIKEKLLDEKRYLLQNDSLNDSEKENQIRDLTKNAMEEINPSVFKKFEIINDLYNIEDKIIGIQKVVKQKRNVIDLQKEEEALEFAKAKLEIIDKYEPIMEIMEKYRNNKYFKKFNESKYGVEIEMYIQAKNELNSMEINNWDKYNEAKSIYDEDMKNITEDENGSEVKDSDNTEEFKKIAKYKNRQNDIIKRYSGK